MTAFRGKGSNTALGCLLPAGLREAGLVGEDDCLDAVANGEGDYSRMLHTMRLSFRYEFP